MAKKFGYQLPGTDRILADVVMFPIAVRTDLSTRAARVDFAVYASQDDAAKALARMLGLRTESPRPLEVFGFDLTGEELTAAMTSAPAGATRLDDNSQIGYDVAAGRLAAALAVVAPALPDAKALYFNGATDVTLNPARFADSTG